MSPLLNIRTSFFALAVGGGLAGCSLLNSFPNENPDSGTGGTSATGGMGGVPSSGGVSGTGGGGGMVPVDTDPGLVVVAGDLGGDVTDPVLVALSPYTGEELARSPGSYQAAVHEAERDLWFLIQGTELRAAKFDLVENRWEFEGSEAVVPEPADAGQVFALNGTLSILRADGTLDVFDTSNLDEIQLVGSAMYPAPLERWGAVGIPSGTGGNIYVLFRTCPGGEGCTVRGRRIRVSGDEVQTFPDAVIDTLNTETTTSIGSITQDASTDTPVVVIPDKDGNTTGTSTVWTVSNSLAPQTSFTLTQRSSQPRTSAFDPCQGVLYVMVPQQEPMVAIGTTDDPEKMEMVKQVGVNGQGMTFEPYTRSLILQQQSGDNFTVDAWRVSGTSLTPNLTKRQNNWAPPSLRPRFVTVATPRQPICE